MVRFESLEPEGVVGVKSLAPCGVPLLGHTHSPAGCQEGIFHSLGMQLTVWPTVPLNDALLLFPFHCVSNKQHAGTLLLPWDTH